jgi:hypothetical protein
MTSRTTPDLVIGLLPYLLILLGVIWLYRSPVGKLVEKSAEIAVDFDSTLTTGTKADGSPGNSSVGCSLAGVIMAGGTSSCAKSIKGKRGMDLVADFFDPLSVFH